MKKHRAYGKIQSGQNTYIFCHIFASFIYIYEHACSCTYFTNKTFLYRYTRNLIVVTSKKRLGEMRTYISFCIIWLSHIQVHFANVLEVARLNTQSSKSSNYQKYKTTPPKLLKSDFYNILTCTQKNGYTATFPVHFMGSHLEFKLLK